MLDIDTNKNILKGFVWRKNVKGIYQEKHVFSKVLSINESTLWRHNLKKKNSYKMTMDDPIRIILVPLNFILQGLPDKNKKVVASILSGL